MRIGTNELLIILAVALLIFGPKNLPKPEDSDDSEEKAEKKAAKKDEDEE